MHARIHLSLIGILAILSFAPSTARMETQRSASIVFEDSGVNLSTGGSCFSIALGDVDGDNDLDAFVGFGYQIAGAPVRLYRNLAPVATRSTSWGEIKGRFGDRDGARQSALPRKK